MTIYTSAKRRAWFAHYHAGGTTVAATCRHFGIARATFYKWLGRYDFSQPQKPLRSRSRRPKKRHPTWTRADLRILSGLVCEPPVPGRQLIYTRLCGREDRHLRAADEGIRDRWIRARRQFCDETGTPRFSARTIGRMLQRLYPRCPVCRGVEGQHDAYKHAVAALRECMGGTLRDSLPPVPRPQPAPQRPVLRLVPK